MVRNERIALFFGLLLISLFIAFDLIDDMKEGSTLAHVWIEGVLLSLSATGAAYLWWRWLQERKTGLKLRADLASVRAEVERFREETKGLAQGMGEKIEEQFQRWKLSRSECDVALLMIKGLSHKEIADLRKTSERTVRQQATSIYRKSQIQNRHELIAFFLEDILAGC